VSRGPTAYFGMTDSRMTRPCCASPNVT